MTRNSRGVYKAFIVPFALFIALLGVADLLNAIFKGHGPLFVADPIYWIFPVQTVGCGFALARYWKFYSPGPIRQPILTVIVAIIVFVLWIAPQQWLGFEQRLEGFNPDIFANTPACYWTNLTLRFIRLVIVVPLLEEIFWRGFLLRYLIDERFMNVPFGTAQWESFSAVTICFGLAHFGPDFVPALLTGALYNGLACFTKSLTSCIIAHALTNLLLGIYIMQTRQFGFW